MVSQHRGVYDAYVKIPARQAGEMIRLHTIDRISEGIDMEGQSIDPQIMMKIFNRDDRLSNTVGKRGAHEERKIRSRIGGIIRYTDSTCRNDIADCDG